MSNNSKVPLYFDDQSMPSDDTLKAMKELESGQFIESSLNELLELKSNAQS